MKYIVSTISAVFLTMFLAGAAPGAEQPVKRVVAVIDADGVQRVEMQAGGYFFDPGHITVKKDVPVELVVKREAGMTPHDIELKAPEAGIDFSVDITTEPKVIKFTPTKAGTYEFTCEKRFLFFKSHKDRGMHGVLVVVE
ncbi:MAG: quinol oxidase [Nitrospirae bacterium GWC2_57_13]|jgi:plastocyanin domain-containing protein|nr:MAG: quinol oxidase [Nitrospirae bacterium GWC2_57_13]OGW43128.1 MAG: quinol oxidase [Nitrospirae bacterium GWD2_57_8]HAR46853.1 quinol oxidase [Nitrospiraceae bacterium]HAS53614.1 quinol oxidase [Nitrospiraceae bacterium]